MFQFPLLLHCWFYFHNWLERFILPLTLIFKYFLATGALRWLLHCALWWGAVCSAGSGGCSPPTTAISPQGHMLPIFLWRLTLSFFNCFLISLQLHYQISQGTIYSHQEQIVFFIAVSNGRVSLAKWVTEQYNTQGVFFPCEYILGPNLGTWELCY